jgi:hypothetical protein
MYIYCFIGFFTPLGFTFASFIIKVENIPYNVHRMLPMRGLLWPEHIRDIATANAANATASAGAADSNMNIKIFNSNNLIVQQMLHFSIFLTFGLASPVLCLTITFVILSETYTYEVYICRYIHTMTVKGPETAKLLVGALEKSVNGVWYIPRKTGKLVLYMCILFYIPALFDISSDEVGTMEAILISCTSLLLPVLVHVVFSYEVDHLLPVGMLRPFFSGDRDRNPDLDPEHPNRAPFRSKENAVNQAIEFELNSVDVLSSTQNPMTPAVSELELSDSGPF